MNYIKIFETHDTPIEVTIVTFNPDGDYIKGLYIDGILEFSGDEYHDDIGGKIEGFLYALKWFSESYTYPLKYKLEKINCRNHNLNYNISDMGNPVPKDLFEVTNGINEEFIFRRLRYENELDAEEIEILLRKKMFTNLKSSKSRGKRNEYLTEYTFEIENHQLSNTTHKIKVVMENNLHPRVKTPGVIEYYIYQDGKLLNCSRKIAKSIYRLVSKG